MLTMTSGWVIVAATVTANVAVRRASAVIVPVQVMPMPAVTVSVPELTQALPGT